MTEYAAPDYEPSADEIDEFLASMFADPPAPGSHGEIVIIPGFERYIWNFPVFWGHRHVLPNGHVSLAYCVPLPCPQEEA